MEEVLCDYTTSVYPSERCVCTPIPLSALQGGEDGTQNNSPSELTVSLPCEHFVAVPASTLSVLYTQLTELQSHPSGWMDAT